MEKDVEDPGSARAQNSAKFLHALVVVLLWYVVRFFVVYCVCVVYCVFVLWFLCCGMFAFVYRKRSWSGFSSRRREGDKLLDARGDSFQEEGGIADGLNPIASLMLCYWR